MMVVVVSDDNGMMVVVTITRCFVLEQCLSVLFRSTENTLPRSNSAPNIEIIFGIPCKNS